jgi:cystathionine beta-lyase/cystathionine gamma-synthase
VSSKDSFRSATLAIHGGLSPDPATGAILTPIYQSTTYVQEVVGVHKGFTYSRAANPTVDALERALGALENTPPAVCFATGMAAIATLFFSVLKAGDHAIISEVVYGGTVRLFQQLLHGLEITSSFVDASDARAVEQAITPRTRIILVETPGNPTLTLCDVSAIAAVAHKHGVKLAVDNTFLTPVLQPVLDIGADISVLSTTKYIEGHNATVGGSLATRDAALLDRFRLIRKTTGCIQSPQEAWLTLRGLKTLPARMKLHSENAQVVAEWLEAHPAVERVHYPGLRSFPQRDLAERQHQRHGGMLSFEIKASSETAVALMNSVKLCSLAENLGAVETLITHPASMTHADVPAEKRSQIGITDGLIRLSVGLEAPEDIIADLDQALTVAFAGTEGRAQCAVTR